MICGLGLLGACAAPAEPLPVEPVAAPVVSRPYCDVRANVLGYLQGDHGEQTSEHGVTGAGGLIEVLTSDRGETWTIVVTGPNGVTCMVSTGYNWRRMAPRPDGPNT